MKSILYVLTMCFCLGHYVHADEDFDLDDVTIELVEEGEEIAHQIHIPFIEEHEPGVIEQVDGQPEETVSESAKPVDQRPAHEPRLVENEQGDEFLELMEDAEELEELLESEQQTVMELADEMLQQAEEEVHELEQEVEVTGQELEEERRDEEALIDEIKHYEDTEEEEDPGEDPEETDKERDEEEEIDGVGREGASMEGVGSEGSFD